MTKPIDEKALEPAAHRQAADLIKRLAAVQTLNTSTEHVQKPENIEHVPAAHEGLREVLEFYAEAWTFKTNERYGGLEWSPMERLLDDCGNRAKDAIATLDAMLAGEAIMGTDKAVISSTEQAKLGTAPEAAGLEPRCDQPVPTTAFQQVREALELAVKLQGRTSTLARQRYEQALALLPALRPVERGEVSVVAKIKRASFLPEQRDIEAKELVIYSSQAIGFVEDAARTTGPVSVELLEIASALKKDMRDNGYPHMHGDSIIRMAKAVLDSAKQQGAQIHYVD